MMATLLKGHQMTGPLHHSMDKPGSCRDPGWWDRLLSRTWVSGACTCVFASQSCPEDCGDLPPVLGAAFLPASLWLRHAGRQVCAHGRRQPEAQVPRGERERPAAPGLAGCQPGQVPGSRCPSVSGMPWSGALARRWYPPSGGHTFLSHPFHTLSVSCQRPCCQILSPRR